MGKNKNIITTTDNSVAQLFIRVALGVVILPHGAQKVFGWFGGPGWAKTIETMGAMGFSPWMVKMLMGIELLGGLLLILGFLTRVWALGIGVTMTVCMVKFHLAHGFFMNWSGTQQGEGYEYHLLVLGICLALFCRGGGMLSVDRLLTRDRRKGRIFY